jgi:tetratricopeptide (TPR) repeat protein
LIEKVVDLTENLTPIALIGAGGIGKTSIALTVLHHDRIKRRFGANRRFVRCDQFPPSCLHLLSRLSKVIGAGVENPEDLGPLRSCLSSREILIVLDNAESILDPEGPDAQKIYAVVEELSQLDNICLFITSHISTIPPDCETLEVPTLSINAARDAFYRIYKNAEKSDSVDNILDQLDFHPLSITLLATVAHQNKWSMDRLAGEWERQRTGMLRTMHNGSFAATIELFLASPMFQELGPDARQLLEVVAFFPQGIDENNLDWLFPAISNVIGIFDRFCVLSLTYLSNSFITMLAPLRDHLHPKDPKSSRLLSTAKEQYFARMSVNTDPNKPGFEESRWIVSEDVNVEHLLDVFTTIDAKSASVWDACADFIRHLAHHKQRFIILGPKIEGLPDRHRSKPKCLFQLSRLSKTVGNHAERKRLLNHTLKLWRERGNDRAVAQTLCRLADANRLLDLHKEGTKLVEEASENFKQLGDTAGQARCSTCLARLLYAEDQLDAAEEAAFHAIDLLSEKGERHLVCELHRLLGQIYRSKCDREKAAHHLEVARGLASSFNWHQQLFWIHCDLARLFLDEGRFDDAQTHVECARLHTLNHTYFLGHAMKLQAELWYKQDRLEEARSEALRAVEVYEKLGATKDLKKCSELLQHIEEKTNRPDTRSYVL